MAVGCKKEVTSAGVWHTHVCGRKVVGKTAYCETHARVSDADKTEEWWSVTTYARLSLRRVSVLYGSATPKTVKVREGA